MGDNRDLSVNQSKRATWRVRQWVKTIHWDCWVNARFTPNRGQLRTDLRVENFWISWTLVKFLSLDRKLAFTSTLGSDWHTSKQKAYNWLSNKSDLRSHHDRLASSRPSHVIRKSIGITSGPRITTAARQPWYTRDLRLTCGALRPISDRPTTWARPPRVTCLTRQKFAWYKNFESDRFMIVPNDIRGHQVINDQPAKTCDQRRMKLISSTTVFDG